MASLENLKAFLLPIISFFRASPAESELLPRTRLPPTSFSGMELHQRPTNDLETLQQDSPPSTIDLESAQPPMQPLALPSTNDPEPLQPQAPPPTPPTTPTNLNQRETSLLAAQQHLQWTNQVLSFCFSYPLALSLQYAQTVHQPHQLNSSFVFLSFIVLLAFVLILVARFISPSCIRTAQVLEKAAILVAAAAFCHTTAIPFPFELKCGVFAVFLLSLILIAIFGYLNRNIA